MTAALLKKVSAVPRSTPWIAQWLEELDGNSDRLSSWCRASPFDTAKGKVECHVCQKSISFSQHGVAALRSHAKSDGHRQKMAARKNTPKITFGKANVASTSV